MGELAVVKDYTAIKLPDDVTDQQGALIEPAAVAVHAVDRSGLQPGGSILITAGPIGALAVLAARAAGAGRILAPIPTGAAASSSWASVRSSSTRRPNRSWTGAPGDA